MTEPPPSLTVALADRYRVERSLGAGGMADVYLAHDLRHDRKVALKVLRPELAAAIGPEGFLREIRTTANLQHPHVLGLLDSGQSAGQLWYAMPFVDGESLRDQLRREALLPIQDTIRIAREVADALDYAHRHGVIHRDIKSENILLHDGRALVADFGIALAAAADGQRMTETGLFDSMPSGALPITTGARPIFSPGRSDTATTLPCTVRLPMSGANRRPAVPGLSGVGPHRIGRAPRPSPPTTIWPPWGSMRSRSCRSP